LFEGVQHPHYVAHREVRQTPPFQLRIAHFFRTEGGHAAIAADPGEKLMRSVRSVRDAEVDVAVRIAPDRTGGREVANSRCWNFCRCPQHMLRVQRPAEQAETQQETVHVHSGT
jgi:hypothetical protein